MKLPDSRLCCFVFEQKHNVNSIHNLNESENCGYPSSVVDCALQWKNQPTPKQQCLRLLEFIQWQNTNNRHNKVRVVCAFYDTLSQTTTKRNSADWAQGLLIEILCKIAIIFSAFWS